MGWNRLIDFNRWVDKFGELKVCVEFNCFSEDKENIWDDEYIFEVEDCRDEFCDFEFGVEVKCCVEKEVNCRRVWC